MRNKIKCLLLLGCVFVSVLGMNSCSANGVAEGLVPVKGFDKKRYLGKWYEVARLDNRFERGMSRVSAEYSTREDGGIKVVNRGYIEDEKKWSEASGKAYFVGDEDTAHLKVSFFGPFYGSYVVFDLDKENYQYAYVGSDTKKYLWFLSRKPVITEEEKQRFLAKVKALGYAVDELIFVDHSEVKP